MVIDRIPAFLRRTRINAGIAAVALCAAAGAQAAAVFDNGGPDQVSGVNMNANVVAEDFTLGAATTLTSIRFWSLMASTSDYSGTIGWRILSDVGGTPGAEVASGSVSPALTATGSSSAFGYGEYVFDISLSESLLAGSYWLELGGLVLDPLDPLEMLWETTATGQGAQALYLDAFSGDWVSASQNLAFVLNGDDNGGGGGGNAPEPATLALSLIALAAAAGARRKA